MPSTEIQIAGFGGQGIILAGIVVGKAACLHEGKYATLTQSFGPEARGSACSAQLIISDEPVLYPYLSGLDILVAMSQEAYRRFSPNLHAGGTLVLEEELVKPDKLGGRVQVHKIPATRLAEELGRRLVLNIVMVGFFTAVTALLGPESVKKAVADSVPPGTEALNLTAFDKGYAYGLAQMKASHTSVVKEQ